MKKVLLPIDFSDNAQQAVKYAIEMFGEKVYQGKIEFILFYVEPYRSKLAPLASRFPYAVNVSPQELVEQRKEKLIDYSKGLKDVYPDQQFKVEFVEGDIIDTTVNYCEENKVDLIVMGTKGATGIRKVIMGSTAKGLVSEAPCPVLVVPEAATYKAPKRILFATDFLGIDNLNVLDQLKDIVRMYKSELMTLHIYSEKETAREDKEAINKLLKNYFSTNTYKHYFLEHHDAAEGIEEFVKGYNASMLALVSRDRTFMTDLFHQSVTKQMLTHTEIPVFVLKEPSTVIRTEQKFRNEVQRQVEKWKGDLEELNLQLTLGKADMTDDWETQKSQMQTWVERAKAGLEERGKLVGEYGEKLKAAVESLQVQLALGKAETRDTLEEQRRKIDQAILSVLHNLDAKKEQAKTTKDKIVDETESGLLNFRNRFEHLFIQFNLGSKEAKDTWEKRRKELNQNVHEVKKRLAKTEDIAEDRWQHFKSEISESLKHLKQAFMGDKV